MGSYFSVITLNENGLNAPTKRQRLAEQIKTQDPYICCLQETHLKIRDKNSLPSLFLDQLLQKFCKLFICLFEIYIVVESLSHVGLFAIPWTAACLAFLSYTVSYSPDYCTQQGSHSSMKEKSKAFQTSKS